VELLDGLARTGIAVGLALGNWPCAAREIRATGRAPLHPIASGLGIAMVIPAATRSRCSSARSSPGWSPKRNPEAAQRYVVPVSSGLIAGESLMGVVIALLIVSGILHK